VACAFFGLISAIERFDPARGIKFETFAAPRIEGSILDELRTLDWVPRSIRSKARELQRERDKLERRLGRTPSVAEIAAALGVTSDEFQSTRMSVSQSQTLALDMVGGTTDADEQLPLLDTLADASASDPLAEVGILEGRAQLSEAIARLPTRERAVVSLRYYQNLTLSEIGTVLGVTESRASQLRVKAVSRLRAALCEEASLCA
jgi:RNA polymerase sigma factor for flagellar operon FliA